MAAILHVTNGDSTRLTLAQAGLGEDVLAWRDALWVGPVPDPDADALRPLRAAFMDAAGWAPRDTAEADLRERDQRLRAALGQRPVVLWFEHDLYDQLQLLQVLSFVGPAAVGAEGLALIVVDRFPGRPQFRGLGELGAGELASLWPQRRPLTASEHRFAGAAWRAVTAPDPTALATLAGGAVEAAQDDGIVALLRPALRRLLEELPGARDGLSRTERQILATVRDGAGTAPSVFVASQALEEAPFAGDLEIWAALRDLAGGGQPLLTLDGADFATATVALTALGEDVLRGQVDAVAARGVDRWVGGVHLHGPAVPWRWDGGAGALS